MKIASLVVGMLLGLVFIASGVVVLFRLAFRDSNRKNLNPVP